MPLDPCRHPHAHSENWASPPSFNPGWNTDHKMLTGSMSISVPGCDPQVESEHPYRQRVGSIWQPCRVTPPLVIILKQEKNNNYTSLFKHIVCFIWSETMPIFSLSSLKLVLHLNPFLFTTLLLSAAKVLWENGIQQKVLWQLQQRTAYIYTVSQT